MPVLRLAGVMVLAALVSGPCFAQRETDGFPEDWTHHHVVFSDPGTLHDASARGSFDTWYKIVTDPRFIFQQHKRGPLPHRGKGNQAPQTDPLGRDWSATLGGAGVAPGMYPAKWQFNVTSTPSCSDYVIFPVNKAGVSGSGGQPNIVGYQNLYVNAGGTGACPGTAPTVLFSYFVGTGTVQTSPVLGGSVGEVAYVESIAGGSKFHVLKGAGTGAANSNGTIAIPVAPGAGGSTASDVFVTLNGGVSVTRSSPFYLYGQDVAFVGDDNGKLHKFTPVFDGTPAEVTTGGWPVTVSTQTGKILTGPVFDFATGMIFVGDSQGYLYSVSATNVVTQSGQLGSGDGIVEPPMVDSTAKSVYVFVGDNAGGTASAVYVFNISSGNISGTGSSVTVGTNSATVPQYGGAFDNIYFSSANGQQPAGNLYVCGNAGGNPTLYQIPITYSSGPVLGSVVTGPVLATSNVACSPLTEFYNSTTSTDWLFGAVPANSCGAGTGAGGCVMSFNITNGAPTIGPWTPSTAYTSTSEVVDTKGQLQMCTGGGCLFAGQTSGSSTPVWITGAGTTPDGVTTNASAIGTVSANSAIGGATVTIGALTLIASAPTAAKGTATVVVDPTNGDTTGIAGTTYIWRNNSAGCGATPNCIIRGGTAAQEAANLVVAINGAGVCGHTSGGKCVFNGTTNANVSASIVGAVATLTAKILGTTANALTLTTSRTTSIHLNGLAQLASTLGAGTAGTNGLNVAPFFRYWGGAARVTSASLASNIAAAAAGNAANVTLTYTSGNTFTASGTGTNAGAAGNSVAVGRTLTGFAWSPTGHLAGGTSALIWTFQGGSNGQTTAPEATGTSAIIIDTVGTGIGASAGEANIYFGTLSGTGAANAAVKMTQAGLQ